MVKTLKGSYFRPQISVIDAEQIDKSQWRTVCENLRNLLKNNNITELV